MKSVLQIPHEIGLQLGMAAELLHDQRDMLRRELEVWADEDPDPANGYFWTVQIAHPEVEAMSQTLEMVALLLSFLAAHGHHGQPVERVEEVG